jgi:D-proline reductase (dithiol) PrdB
MVRLSDIDPGMREFLLHMDCPDTNTNAWCDGPPLRERRVALISSAGLRRRDDRPFTVSAADYRILPLNQRDEIIQDHMNASHDRTGYLEDLNTIFPLDRLVGLAESGEIGSVADYHYSFMGATKATALETEARRLAGILKADNVDAVVFCPV